MSLQDDLLDITEEEWKPSDREIAKLLSQLHRDDRWHFCSDCTKRYKSKKPLINHHMKEHFKDAYQSGGNRSRKRTHEKDNSGSPIRKSQRPMMLKIKKL